MITMSSNDTKSGHSLLRGRIWILVLLAVMLVAGHGIILYYTSSHLALSAGLVAAVGLLIVVKHLGLLGSAQAVIRRAISGKEKPSKKD